MSLSQLLCKETSSKLGKLCVTEEDVIIIFANILVVLLILIFLYKNYFFSNRTETLNSTLYNKFTLLGEGNMSKYYSPVTAPQKNTSTKKKSMKNNNTNSHNTTMEKASGVNELYCNKCNNSVKVSYQYTLHKLIN